MKKESSFQAKLIKRIKDEFPGSFVFKNDEQYIQGIPDLTILYKDRWAVLECKRSLNASHRPNQDHYISELNDMSYASFVYPENEEEVFNGLRTIFKSCREACPVKPE